MPTFPCIFMACHRIFSPTAKARLSKAEWAPTESSWPIRSWPSTPRNTVPPSIASPTRRNVSFPRRRKRSLDAFEQSQRHDEEDRTVTAAVGHVAVMLGFVLALWGIAAPVLLYRTGNPKFLSSARVAILGQFVLVTLAASALIYGLVTTDFSIQYRSEEQTSELQSHSFISY